ncbi:MAG: hypothetical protein ACLP0A_17580, partial [Verrucomicrobiia bacterium]
SNTYYSVYSSNIAAEVAAEAAQASSTPTLAMGGGFVAMDDDEMDDGDPCTVPTNANFAIISISQDTNGWTWLTAAPTCTNYLVGWFSTNTLAANSLSTNVTWTSLSGGWAGNGTSTFADQTTRGVTQRFYYAILVLPTTNSVWNGGAIPEIWLADQGLNPFDPNVASEISTNPWAHGLTNLQVYENPSVLISNNYSTVGDGIPDWWKVTYGFSLTDPTVAGADPDGDGLCNLVEYLLGTDPLVPDAPMDMIVNGGAAYTPSLTVPILATTTNYPNIRVSTDPLMNNATVVAITDGLASYTLPDNGDGLYYLYLQYADAAGQPHGIIVTKSVTLDRLAPVVYITSPASNAVLNQAFITLQAVAADPDPVIPDDARPLSISINGQPFWNRAGTNITIERFPVPVGSNSLTVTIQAVDLAGNTNTASQTWTVNTSTATNAPNLLTVNLSSSMLLPNVNSIWVEGTVDNDYALINAIVFAASGDVTTNSLNVSENQYEGSVPLESGTNQVVLLASDAAGNASSNVYTIISSTEFSGAITNPVFGTFATAPSNYVSGYVSALYDAGLPTQTNITTVTVNGVAAILGTNVDAYGNLPFWTTNVIPLGVPITAVVGGPGVPTDPPSLPPMQSQVYEVTAKSSEANSMQPGLDDGGAYWSSDGGCWGVNVVNVLVTNAVSPTGGDSATVTPYFASRDASGCTGDPANDPSIWQPWSQLTAGDGYSDSAHALSFGTDLSYQYAFFDTGEQWEWPWPNVTTASVTFRAPVQYAPNTTVIFTFEGVSYETPDGVAQDLSQVKYLGLSPVSNDASSVSYLITVNGGQTYTINQDSFQWPSFTTNSVQRTYCCDYDYEPNSSYTTYSSDTFHSLSWTNFHNALPQIIGPTNLYVYCNSSPSSGVFYVTNAIPATSVSWSVTTGGDKVQINSTTGVATPTDASHASTSVNDVTISAAVTFQGGQSATLTAQLTVRKPGAFGGPSIAYTDPLPQGYGVDAWVSYRVLDQLCQPFPAALINGTAATESFTGNPDCYQPPKNGTVQSDGTVLDHIAVTYGCEEASIKYQQVITADCAVVTNSIITNPGTSLDVVYISPVGVPTCPQQ